MSEKDFFEEDEFVEEHQEFQPHGGSLKRLNKTISLKPNIAFDAMQNSVDSLKIPPAQNLPTVQQAEEAMDMYSHLTLEFVYSRITEYFLFCTDKQVPATFNGLALRLDVEVEDLKTLPFKNPAVQYAFKKAKMIISEFVETQLLMGKSPVGLIFWLKNMDNWVDKTEVITRKGMGEELNEQERIRNAQKNIFKPIDVTPVPPAQTPAEPQIEAPSDQNTPTPVKPANFPF